MLIPAPSVWLMTCAAMHECRNMARKLYDTSSAASADNQLLVCGNFHNTRQTALLNAQIPAVCLTITHTPEQHLQPANGPYLARQSESESRYGWQSASQSVLVSSPLGLMTRYSMVGMTITVILSWCASLPRWEGVSGHCQESVFVCVVYIYNLYMHIYIECYEI